MSKRKKFEQPFNRRIPPLFLKGGLLDKSRELGARIRFLVEMPEEHANYRQWQHLYEAARAELADICFLEERCATYAEQSQLDWVREAGHRLWLVDVQRPRCNLNSYIAELERKLKDKPVS
jgi:hypothetical protein